jgi:hypothetical protein
LSYSTFIDINVRILEGSVGPSALRMAMPFRGMRDFTYYYSISKQLLCRSIFASGALSQTPVDRVGREKMDHYLSG